MSSAAQVTCSGCGAPLRAATAARTGGLCITCKHHMFWTALVYRVHDAPDGFDRLSDAEQTYYLIKVLEGEVVIGGLRQFFEKGSGDFYRETLRALEEVGAMNCHALLVAAKEVLFPYSDPPRDQAARYEMMPQYPEAEDAPRPDWDLELDRINGQFHPYTDQLQERLLRYALDHQLVGADSMRAPPKFSRHQIVRIKSQPPARARLVGEWGIVGFVAHGLVGSGPKADDLDPLDVPPGLATNIYMVSLYREALFRLGELGTMLYWFNEVDLESGGEFAAFSTGEKPEAAARIEVARAIARDQLYICACHGLAEYIPGIVAADSPMVESLPRITVAYECYADPEKDAWWRAFAEVFNQELLKHLLKSKQ